MIVKTQLKKTYTRKRKFVSSVAKPQPTNTLYDSYLKNKDKIKSIDIDPIAKQTTVETYTGEMAEREALAQEEIERKKLRTAPAYSKGAYQYISELDLPYLGRKI